MEGNLLRNFIFACKNYHELQIDEAHVVTAHDGVEHTMKYYSNRSQSQALSDLVQLFVANCNTGPCVKQSNQPALGLVTPLHVSVRP